MNAQDAGARGRDREDRPAEGIGNQVVQDGATHAARLLRRADHGDVGRLQNGVQLVPLVGHGVGCRFGSWRFRHGVMLLR